MISLHESLRSVSVALLLLSAMVSTSQATRLVYTGLEFLGTDAGEGRVEGAFNFVTPLVANSSLTLADVSDWSLSAAGVTITSDTASFAMGEFEIGLDGLPEVWSVVAELPTGPGDSVTQITTTSIINVGIVGDVFSPADEAPNNPFPTGIASTAPIGGVWTVVPEPSSLLIGLIASGIVGASVRRN